MGRIYSKLEYIYALHEVERHIYFISFDETPYTMCVDEMLELGRKIDDENKIKALIKHVSSYEDDYFGVFGRTKDIVENKDLLIMLGIKLLNLPDIAIRKFLGMTNTSYSVRKSKAINRYSSNPDFKSRVITIINTLK